MKLFVLRSVGFFAWWQAQVNKALYQEILNTHSETTDRESVFQEKLNELLRKMNGLLNGNMAFQAKVIELASKANHLRDSDKVFEHRLGELSPKIDGLVISNMAFQAKIIELASQANDLKGRDKFFEDRLNYLSSQVDQLGNPMTLYQVKMPELASKVDELLAKDKNLEWKLNELLPKTQRFADSMGAFQSKLIELGAEVAQLRDRTQFPESKSPMPSSPPDLTQPAPPGSKWIEFYEKEIKMDDMDDNINHHRYFIDLVIDWANRACDAHPPRIIEVGIGTGTMSIYLSKNHFTVLGVDVEPLIVNQAINTNRKLGGHAKFISINALDLPAFFKEQCFDVAFSQGTMEHFGNDEVKEILDAQLFVAKYVIISVPSINWPSDDFGNERRLRIEDWELLLNAFNVRIEHLSYYQEGNLHIAAVISKSEDR